jgi:hypothetical protein
MGKVKYFRKKSNGTQETFVVSIFHKNIHNNLTPTYQLFSFLLHKFGRYSSTFGEYNIKGKIRKEYLAKYSFKQIRMCRKLKFPFISWSRTLLENNIR